MAMTPQGWSISALAVELGRDRRTIAAACAQVEPCGSDRRGKLYRLAEVIAVLNPAAKPADADEARARKLAAEAELAEMERDERRGQLVPISVVERVVSEEYAAVRAKLLSLPGKLAPLVAIEDDEVTCRDLIERGVTEALDELARDAGEIGADAADAAEGIASGDAETAATPDRQRVG